MRLIGGLNLVTEIYAEDPYTGISGGAYQAGFRYIISEQIQVDVTIGGGLWGDPNLDTFVGAGLRIVSGRLW